MYIQAPTLKTAIPTVFMAWLRAYFSHSITLNVLFIGEAKKKCATTMPRVAAIRNYFKNSCTEDLKSLTVIMTFCWDVTPCSLVEGYRNFGETIGLNS